MSEVRKPRPIKPSDISPGARILAEAFHHDPLFQAFFPEKDERGWNLRRLFEAVLSWSVDAGTAWGIGQPLAGVAIWSQPRRRVFLPSWNSLWAAIRFLGTGAFFRFLDLLPIFTLLEKAKKTLLPKEYLYLEVLAVSPRAHRQGFARALVKPITQLGTKRHLPVYLETNNPVNVPIYEHFGFEVRQKILLPNQGDLKAWCFVRQPV